MKSYNLIIMASILLLTACQIKQPSTTSTMAAIQSLPSEVPETHQVNELQSSTIVPIISPNKVSFQGYPQQTEYNTIAALAIETVQEQEGVFGGSPVIWNTINDGKFLHFYYTITYPEKLQPEYAGYAIVGENIKLTCGLHVGMTAKEAEAIIPGLYHFKWDNSEYVSALDWNSNVYPDSWCRQFPQILIAEVDNDNETPLTIGLLLDEQDIIRAIAFNSPTAG